MQGHPFVLVLQCPVPLAVEGGQSGGGLPLHPSQTGKSHPTPTPHAVPPHPHPHPSGCPIPPPPRTLNVTSPVLHASDVLCACQHSRHCLLCWPSQLCPGGIVLFSDKQCDQPEDLVEPLKGGTGVTSTAAAGGRLCHLAPLPSLPAANVPGQEEEEEEPAPPEPFEWDDM